MQTIKYIIRDNRKVYLEKGVYYNRATDYACWRWGAIPIQDVMKYIRAEYDPDDFELDADYINSIDAEIRSIQQIDENEAREVELSTWERGFYILDTTDWDLSQTLDITEAFSNI